MPSLFSRESFKESWELTRKPLALWLFVMVVVLTMTPTGWHMLLTTCGEYYDAGNYTNIALNGYYDERIAAFYPLWPVIIRIVSFGSTDRPLLGYVGAMTAASIFLFTIHLMIVWFKRQRLTRHLQLGVWLLILSPLSLFRVLSFTESLFSFLAVCLIWELSSDSPSLVYVALWSALLSLARPLFPILMVASVVIMFVIHLSGMVKHWNHPLNKKLLTVFVAAPIGYIPFGYYCLEKLGNFWAPFDAQKYWDRHFGLHWNILFSPKVINGSNEVLVWDLLAFYGPFILFACLLWYALRYKTKHLRTLSPETTTALLLAVLIAAAHAALAFLTHDRFMSLSRHVLANPLLYITLFAVTTTAREEREVWIRRFYLFLITGSTVFLGMWWNRFVHDRWIG